MKGFFNRPEHFFLALIAAFGVYILLFMYFQISSYKQYVLIKPYNEFSKIEEDKEIIIAKENIQVPNQNSGFQPLLKSMSHSSKIIHGIYVSYHQAAKQFKENGF